MMDVIVVCAGGRTEHVRSVAVGAGLRAETFPNLPDHMVIHGGESMLATIAAAAGESALVELDTSPLYPLATNYPVTVQLDGAGEGAWGPCRVIRRRNPLRWPNNSYPIGTRFECERDGGGCDVFMIDSGCDTAHPEFGGRVTQPWAYAGVPSTPLDGSGHGTSVMSCAVGGSVGVARSAAGVSLKFTADGSSGSTAGAIAALNEVLSLYSVSSAGGRPGVLVWSWAGFTSVINAAVSAVIDAGVFCSFPAGNKLEDLGAIAQYPAESDPDGMITAGTTVLDTPYARTSGLTGDAKGTNYGTPVDVLAPAMGVRMARRAEDGGGFRVANGTSFAAPLTAGVAACILQGRAPMATRGGVSALKDEIVGDATTGALAPGSFSVGGAPVPFVLPDRILYLDPKQTP